MNLLSSILVAVFCFNGVSGFAPQQQQWSRRSDRCNENRFHTNDPQQQRCRSGGCLSAVPPPTAFPLDDMESARTAFFIWFFGASGAAGVARSAFPRMYNSVRYIQNLKGQGPTKGGETLGLPLFLVGYPEDLCVADIQQIINNRLKVDEIVRKYPVPDNFLAEKGYLTFQAFQQANSNCNPLAVRAIFDSFAQSTDTVEPTVAQDKLNQYRQDLSTLKANLLSSKLVGYSAIALLLFLLGLADVTAAGHAYHGWFPDWPGAQNLPWSLFDPETGISSIPKYWVSDITSETS